MLSSHHRLSSVACRNGLKARTAHNHCPEALLTVLLAIHAHFTVLDFAPVILEKCKIIYFSGSRHQHSPPLLPDYVIAENVRDLYSLSITKGTPGQLGRKVGQAARH